MGKKAFHASVEGAQHGSKGLGGFLKFAKEAFAAGCQPSNFMLEDGKGGFLPAAAIKQKFADAGLKLDGISAHCPIWVQTTAWTGSKAIRPFIPAEVAKMNVEGIQQWAETYTLKLLDLCAELGVKIVPMFWGVAYGWEVATGYPWGFWKGSDYDLIKEGDERFLTLTENIRGKARMCGIKLAHEIHPGTAAMTADDFLRLAALCSYDTCLAVNADPSHCWEGEAWEDRFDKVGDYVCGAHVKNMRVKPGSPMRCMEPAWAKRPMQFTPLERGEVDIVAYAEQMLRVGYAERYCKIQRTGTAPLVVEAEAAVEELDDVSARGIKLVRDTCCVNLQQGSFEDGMGAEKQ